MKELSIAGESICPLLYKHEAEYVAAGYSVKLMALPEEESVQALIQIVNKAYLEMEKAPAGMNPFERKRNLDMFARLIRNDLQLYFPKVTLKEIELAVRKGIRNEFGEFYGFSTVTVHNFIEKYLKSEDRTSAMAKQHRFLLIQQVPEEPPLPNQWEIMKQGLLMCYDTYCKSGRIFDCGSVNYDFLVKAKEIVLTNEEKWFIYSVAEMQVRSEQKTQAITNRLSYRILQEAVNDKGPVIKRSKEIALKNYYDTKPDLNGIMEKLRNAFFESTTSSE